MPIVSPGRAAIPSAHGGAVRSEREQGSVTLPRRAFGSKTALGLARHVSSCFATSA